MSFLRQNATGNPAMGKCKLETLNTFTHVIGLDQATKKKMVMDQLTSQVQLANAQALLEVCACTEPQRSRP